ncbi:MAG: hypothetical protein KKB38_20180 [Gammaproteobacteria bacterium]|nr:hypothetical protein [Gammaproteobacteria bacterium]
MNNLLKDPDFKFSTESIAERIRIAGDYLRNLGIERHPYDIGFETRYDPEWAGKNFSRREFVVRQQMVLQRHLDTLELKKSKFNSIRLFREVEVLLAKIEEMEKISIDIGGFMTLELKTSLDILMKILRNSKVGEKTGDGGDQR